MSGVLLGTRDYDGDKLTFTPTSEGQGLMVTCRSADGDTIKTTILYPKRTARSEYDALIRWLLERRHLTVEGEL